MKTKVLITGGTGLVGQKLSKMLTARNYEVAILSRSPKEKNHYKWDVSENYIDEDALKNTQYIIHLAGAGIADKRWSDDRKQLLIDSRVKTALLLFKAVKEYQVPLRGFISASGIGYYGAMTSNTIFTEADAPHHDFIASICVQWEEAAHQFKDIDVPVTILRTGIVLADKDSALQKINTPLFLSVLGSGKQYFPWIHIDDLCNLYVKAVEYADFQGTFNAVAPEEHTNKSFTKTLGTALNKPILPIHVPQAIMKLTLGKMSKILLEGSRVSSKKTEAVYDFKYPTLKESFNAIFSK